MLTMKLIRNTAMILKDVNGKSTQLQSDEEVIAFLSDDSNLWLIQPHQLIRFIARVTGIKVEKVYIILQTHAQNVTAPEVSPALIYKEVMAILNKLESRMYEDAVIKRAGTDHDRDFRLWLKILAIRFIDKKGTRVNLEKILGTQKLPFAMEASAMVVETPTPSEADTEVLDFEDATPSRSRRVNFQNTQNLPNAAHVSISNGANNTQHYLLRIPATSAGSAAGAPSAAPQIPHQYPQNMQFGSTGNQQVPGPAYAQPQLLRSGNSQIHDPTYAPYQIYRSGIHQGHGPAYAQYQSSRLPDDLSRLPNDRVIPNSRSVHQQTSQSSASPHPAQLPGNAGMRGTGMEVNRQSSLRNDGNRMLGPNLIPYSSTANPSGMPSGYSTLYTQPAPIYPTTSTNMYSQSSPSGMGPNNLSLAGAHVLPLDHYRQSLRPLQLQRQLPYLAGLSPSRQVYGFAPASQTLGHPPSNRNPPAYSPTMNVDDVSPSMQLVPQLQNHLTVGSGDHGVSPTPQSQRAQILRQNVLDGMLHRQASGSSLRQAYDMRQNSDGLGDSQTMNTSRPQTYNFGGSSGGGVGAATYNNFPNIGGLNSSSRVGNYGRGGMGKRPEAEDGEEHDE